MDKSVKNFIETNIQLLENNQTFEFFISAYNCLYGEQQAELIKILDDVIDTQSLKEPVIRYIISRAIEDLVEDIDVSLTKFVYTKFPSGLLGEDPDDLNDYILDNSNEWDRKLVFDFRNSCYVFGAVE